MHEVSLVNSLCRQVVEAVAPIPPTQVLQVNVAMGPLSGVEPLLVLQAFQSVRSSWGLSACELHVDELPLVARCLLCEVEFEVANFVFRCMACGSGQVQVIQGEDFRLVSIEVKRGEELTNPRAEPQQQSPTELADTIGMPLRTVG